MALIQALGYWYVFALPRPWNCTTGKSLKALVTHLPRWWYTRICMPTVNGQRQRTFWVDAKLVRLRHLGDDTVVRSTCRHHDGPKQTKILVTHRAETVSARQMVAIMASLLLLRLQATHVPANRPWSAFQLQRQFMWDVLQAQGERSARQLARKWLPDGQSGMRTFTYLSLLSKYRMGQDDGNDGE